MKDVDLLNYTETIINKMIMRLCPSQQQIVLWSNIQRGIQCTSILSIVKNNIRLIQ